MLAVLVLLSIADPSQIRRYPTLVDWLGRRHLLRVIATAVLTNDVVLFIVVPLTLGVCRITNMPATRLIVFEALAVNAGSALTPIGNPQNIFLRQLSHAPADGAADGRATACDGFFIQQPPARLAHERGSQVMVFHAYSMPFLAIGVALGYGLLF